MASIVSDPNGRKRLQFVATDGRRRALRLGKATMKQAEAVKVKVEQLVSATVTGHAPDDETGRWVAALDDTMHSRLAAVGLTRPRQGYRLAEWLDAYLGERTDLKPNTLTNLRVTRDHMVEFFRADRPMRDIARDEASQWRAKMLADNLSVATVRLYVGNARQFFGEAARRELIAKNVFDHLPAGTTPAKNERYVTSDEAERVLAAIPDRGIKVVFALARYAGLRVPSETHPLTWGDVDWDRGRLTVRSPKTEHHAGHERRVVPITTKLMPVLGEAFHTAAEGEKHLVTGPRSNEYVREKVLAAIRRAEVDVWEDLFRTLRSSCEREWAMTLPQYAVSKWLGHSITVSGKHYANHVPDELFDKVAAGTVQAAQKAAQQPAESPRTASQTGKPASPKTAEIPGDFEGMRVGAGSCESDARTVSFGPSSRRSSAPACG